MQVCATSVITKNRLVEMWRFVIGTNLTGRKVDLFIWDFVHRFQHCTGLKSQHVGLWAEETSTNS